MKKSKFKVVLTDLERQVCLEEIQKRIVRIIYVYEKSQVDENFNYKRYVKNLLIFITSADKILEGELVTVKVNLNSILMNNFNKQQLKTVVFECKNHIDYLLEDGD